MRLRRTTTSSKRSVTNGAEEKVPHSKIPPAVGQGVKLCCSGKRHLQAVLLRAEEGHRQAILLRAGEGRLRAVCCAGTDAMCRQTAHIVQTGNALACVCKRAFRFGAGIGKYVGKGSVCHERVDVV